MTEGLGMGDTVRLRSGGPVMTVNEKAPNSGLVCVWFAADDVRHHTFRPEALERVSAGEAPADTAAAA